jgi:multidrug resistance protein
MFAPSVEMVIQDFHSGNATIGTLVVSIYLLGYAFGPLFIAPLSEMFGRLPVYHCSTIMFILFNIACAKSTNFPMLTIFRVLTGIAGSGPLTLGPGSISDLYRQEERGKIIAIWTLPLLLGPTIGPIAGGYLSESLGWRWDFWFLVIVVRNTTFNNSSA